jgi:hypothetical protein
MFKIDQTGTRQQLRMSGMKSGSVIEAEALKVRCPTCGADPKK